MYHAITLCIYFVRFWLRFPLENRFPFHHSILWLMLWGDGTKMCLHIKHTFPRWFNRGSVRGWFSKWLLVVDLILSFLKFSLPQLFFHDRTGRKNMKIIIKKNMKSNCVFNSKFMVKKNKSKKCWCFLCYYRFLTKSTRRWSNVYLRVK